MPLWIISVISFIVEMADSTLGGGFGTVLSPVLLLMGYSPLQIVPVIMISEICTGILTGGFYHAVGNVDFKDKAIQRMTFGLAFCSIMGVISSVLIAVNIPKAWVSNYIAVLVFSMGLFLVIRGQKKIPFSKFKILGLGCLVGFNKGISGGGYGPIMTAGSILSGVKEKHSIAVISIAEGLTCIAGLVVYYLSKKTLDLQLLPWILLGSLLASPLAAKSVKIMPDHLFGKLVAWFTLILGVCCLLGVAKP